MSKIMRNMIQKIIMIILSCWLIPAVWAGEPDFRQVLQSIDTMNSFTQSDFSAVLTMVSVDPDEGTTVQKVNQFRRDSEDKFVMLVQEPADQKGRGYLRAGDNMWMYDPVSRQFSHFSLKENFQDTDAKHSDFRMSTLAEDYTVTGYKEDKLGKYPVYIVELKAVHDEVTYPFQKLWIRKDNNLLLKTESYSLTSRLLRTALFPNYAKVGGKYIATSIIFRDELIQGKKTQITISDISLDTLPDMVFTKAYVERVNK